jgi:hypothetical protein
MVESWSLLFPRGVKKVEKLEGFKIDEKLMEREYLNLYVFRLDTQVCRRHNQSGPKPAFCTV